MLICQAVAARQPVSRGQKAAGGPREHDEAAMIMGAEVGVSNPNKGWPSPCSLVFFCLSSLV